MNAVAGAAVISTCSSRIADSTASAVGSSASRRHLGGSSPITAGHTVPCAVPGEHVTSFERTADGDSGGRAGARQDIL
ncbi:hypothetical protein ACFW9F_18395 [Streptomyces sp. NPDC059506]|uniref:hypothetical protein n=1 Tax=Streptomyces sp. NPDC059506 TaxID=3347751 RepID=UPI0036A7B2FC